MGIKASIHRNPYIGPRPYQENDPELWGRSREADELVSLVITNGMTVFHAESGAGKSSLLNRVIVPRLKKERFLVLPKARVGLDLPKEVDAQHPECVFAASAILSMSGSVALTNQFVGQKFSEFIDETYVKSPDQIGRLIIFDQFEELFTSHQEQWPHIQLFADQIKSALKTDPSLSVLFVIRQDQVAHLDRYFSPTEGESPARFHMDPLNLAQAIEAIEGPAASAGVPFTRAASKTLAEDLCSIKTDDSRKSLLGQFVEPIHLQLVCMKLWESIVRNEEVKEISVDLLLNYGKADQALLEYYDSVVHLASKETKTPESEIRMWFNQKLISPRHTRIQTDTHTLNAKAVEILVSCYLVRPIAFRDRTVFELSHDRMIDPILSSNEKFLPSRENAVTQSAELWLQAGRDKSYLLRGTRLQKASAWAQDHDVSGLEREFLEASTSEETKFRTRILTLGLVSSVSIIVVLALGMVWLYKQFNAVHKHERQLQASDRTANAANLLPNDPYSSLVISLESASETKKDDEKLGEQQAAILQSAIQFSRLNLEIRVPGHLRREYLAFHPSGTLLAVRDSDTTVKILDSFTGAASGLLIFKRRVDSILFSSDGSLLIALQDNGALSVRDWKNGTEVDPFWPVQLTISKISAGYNNQIALLVNPPRIDIYNLKERKLVSHLDASSSVNSFAFSPDGKYLLIGETDLISIREIGNNKLRFSKLTDGIAEVVGICPRYHHILYKIGANAYLADIEEMSEGSRADSGISSAEERQSPASTAERSDDRNLSQDQSALKSPAQNESVPTDQGSARDSSPKALQRRGEQASENDDGKQAGIDANLAFDSDITGLDFSEEGKLICSSSEYGVIRLWKHKDLRPKGDILENMMDAIEGSSGPSQIFNIHAHSHSADGIFFSPDGGRTVTFEDGVLRIWDLSNASSPVREIAFGYPDPNSNDQTFKLGLLTDDRLSVTSADGGTEFWRGPSLNPFKPNRIEFSADDRYLLVSTYLGAFIYTQGTGIRREFDVCRRDAKCMIAGFRHMGGRHDLLVTATESALPPHVSIEMLDLDRHSKRTATLETVPQAMALSDDGRKLIAVDSTLTISVHEITDLPQLRLNPISKCKANTGERVRINDLAVSKDSKTIAVGLSDGSVQVCKSGDKLSHTLANHDGYVQHVAISDDAKSLASAGSDGEVVITDLETKKVTLKVKHAGSEVTALQFVPKTQDVIYGVAGGELLRASSKLDTDEMLRAAWKKLRRRIAKEECIQKLGMQECPKFFDDYSTAQDYIAAGDVSSASKYFVLVAKESEIFPFDPQVFTRTVIYESKIERTQVLGKLGRTREALEVLNTAKNEKVITWEQFNKAISDLVSSAESRLKRGDVDAILVLNESQEAHPYIEDRPRTQNSICWWGSLWGRAQEVLDICRSAVKHEPTSANFKDSLALANALCGHRPEAIAGFDEYRKTLVGATSDTMVKERHQRNIWIDQLKRGIPIRPDQRKAQLVDLGVSESDINARFR